MAISDRFTRVATRANEAAEYGGALTLDCEGKS